MVKEIRIYIEGGGDKKDTKKAIRIGFSEFLKDKNKIKKLGCIFKKFTVDYEQIEQDLKELKQNSSAHLLEEDKQMMSCLP